jgi:hypothetical protein
MSKICKTFAAVTRLAEGPCLCALLSLKIEISLICLVGARITNSVHDVWRKNDQKQFGRDVLGRSSGTFEGRI